MVKKSMQVALESKPGAMPIAMLVQVASQYASSIYIDDESKRVNAKSIMGMMTLGLTPDKTVIITADGQDEAQAVEGIEAYLCGGRNDH